MLDKISFIDDHKMNLKKCVSFYVSEIPNCLLHGDNVFPQIPTENNTLYHVLV